MDRTSLNRPPQISLQRQIELQFTLQDATAVPHFGSVTYIVVICGWPLSELGYELSLFRVGSQWILIHDLIPDIYHSPTPFPTPMKIIAKEVKTHMRVKIRSYFLFGDQGRVCIKLGLACNHVFRFCLSSIFRSKCNLLNIALEVLALNQVRDIVLILVLLALGTGLLLHVLVALGELAQGGKAVGAKLVEDTGDELGEFLLLAVTVEGEGVGGDGGVDYLVAVTRQLSTFWIWGDGDGSWSEELTLGGGEVDDISVLLEHVDLLDGLDGLDVHLLQGGLELLVVGTGGLVDLLDLAAGSTLSSVDEISRSPGLSIVDEVVLF